MSVAAFAHAALALILYGWVFAMIAAALVVHYRPEKLAALGRRLQASGWSVMSRIEIYGTGISTHLLTRWRIIRTPWFGIFLHKHHNSDQSRHLHDHPWNFTTIVLRGGYDELVPARHGVGMRHWPAGSWHRLHAEDAHTIDHLERTPTWTLMLVGRHRRVWQFHTPDGLVPFHSYHDYTTTGAQP